MRSATTDAEQGGRRAASSRSARTSPGIGPGGGFFTLPNTILHEGTRQQAEFLNELQRLAVEKTRLGIPLLITEEGTHGLMARGRRSSRRAPPSAARGTWTSSGRYTRGRAAEARAIGMHQLFTLVVEPNRDPRLGRNQEGSPRTPGCARAIAETIVRAVQGDDVSAPGPGRRRPVPLPRPVPARVAALSGARWRFPSASCATVFLPPWEAGHPRRRAPSA